jgi:hypothetical protein
MRPIVFTAEAAMNRDRLADDLPGDDVFNFAESVHSQDSHTKRSGLTPERIT